MGAAGRRGRAPRWTATTAVAAVLALGLVAPGPAALPAPGPAVPSPSVLAVPSPSVVAAGRIAGHSLGELLSGTASGRAPLVVAWPRFRAVMGYTPATARLAGDATVRAIKPTGACSSPLGATRFGFGLACEAHDLGYDLLRFAARTGQPFGPWARRGMDDQLARDLHARCAVVRPAQARLACQALAGLYAGVARLNSWRQGYGTP